MVDRSCSTTAVSTTVRRESREPGRRTHRSGDGPRRRSSAVDDAATGTTGGGHGERENVGGGQPAGVTRLGAIDSNNDTARSGAGQTTGGDHTAGVDTTARDAATGGAHVGETAAGDDEFTGRGEGTPSTTLACDAKPR